MTPYFATKIGRVANSVEMVRGLLLVIFVQNAVCYDAFEFEVGNIFEVGNFSSGNKGNKSSIHDLYNKVLLPGPTYSLSGRDKLLRLLAS